MASSKVIFNVGSEQYTTSVDKLTAREKNTFFTELFACDWQRERDPNDDSIFIDRNGKLFAQILEYLRTDASPEKLAKYVSKTNISRHHRVGELSSQREIERILRQT
jgi:hypothetical protein